MMILYMLYNQLIYKYNCLSMHALEIGNADPQPL